MPNFDVLQILSYGVVGLGLLLAYLAYRLIADEQQKENPRRSILVSTYVFMIFSFSLCLVGVGSEYLRSGFDRLGPELDRLKSENAALSKRKDLIEPEFDRLRSENAALAKRQEPIRSAEPSASSTPGKIGYSEQDVVFAKTVEKFLDYITIKTFIFGARHEVQEEVRIMNEGIKRIKANAAGPGKG